MESRLPSSPPLVLAVGLDHSLESSDLFRTAGAENIREASQCMAQGDVNLVVLGSQLTTAQALEFLTSCASEPSASEPNMNAAVIALCAGTEPELFQRFIDDGLIFYLARGEMELPELRSLISCAVGRARIKSKPDPLSRNAPSAEQLLDLCVRLPMQTDMKSASGLLIKTVSELIDGSFVQCLLYDPEEEILVPADTFAEAFDDKEVSYSAASGVTAFAALTGAAVQLKHLENDPRYDREVDNPIGLRKIEFLAQPIIGPAGTTLAVITTAKSTAPLSKEESQIIKFVAETASSTFAQLRLQKRLQAQLTGRASASEANPEIFRREALEHHIRSWDRQGDVLKTLPQWLRTSYWIVLVLVLSGLAGIALLPGIREIFGKGQ
jgi:GAF domain-containing protein